MPKPVTLTRTAPALPTKSPPPKKMTPGEALKRRLADRRAIMGEPAPAAPKSPIRKFMDAGPSVLGKKDPALQKPAPVVRKLAVPAKTGLKPIPTAFADLLLELENARLKKNAWAREFSAKEKEVKEMFEGLGRTTYTCQLTATGEGDEVEDVEVTLNRLEGGTVDVETISKDTLKELVDEETYDKCTVIQKGLVKEHAGEAILKRITTTTTENVEGVIVTLESKKVKGVKKSKK